MQLNYCRTYNEVIDIYDIPQSGNIAEPVTLAEIKNFLRLQGFEDDQESGEVAFSSDDDLLSELITSARQGLEVFTGWSLVAHTWKVLLTNLAGDSELPFSNGVQSNSSGLLLDSIVDCNDVTIDEDGYKVIGTNFLVLQTPLKERMMVTYTTSPTVPKALKQAIMRDVAFHYENRNDLPGELSKQAIALALPFRRPWVFVA